MGDGDPHDDPGDRLTDRWASWGHLLKGEEALYNNMCPTHKSTVRQLRIFKGPEVDQLLYRWVPIATRVAASTLPPR
ncbi:hypothetical protein AAL_01414 [Moelleriella libera RCEF 2490]|uniref:Uncharacterized protein n=1 Tax=Moelleriella libera RCEF 2490 TaxID=1081109 RepID=A0A166U5H7_9HYPO|nr:hypothetical protein AAL_01414 [Moelleriella libera RCEF 2490]